MGRRGPKKTPGAVKKQRGTYRPDRDGGPQFSATCPEPPAWLTDDARAAWDSLAPSLADRQLLTAVDVLAFALLCEAWSDWLAARKELAHYGTTAVTDNGNTYQHPIVGVANKAWQRVLTACREFGLTPSARTGLHCDPGDESSDAGAQEVVGL
jgi:P27 family predicted phage terminase small subunit